MYYYSYPCFPMNSISSLESLMAQEGSTFKGTNMSTGTCGIKFSTHLTFCECFLTWYNYWLEWCIWIIKFNLCTSTYVCTVSLMQELRSPVEAEAKRQGRGRQLRCPGEGWEVFPCGHKVVVRAKKSVARSSRHQAAQHYPDKRLHHKCVVLSKVLLSCTKYWTKQYEWKEALKGRVITIMVQ